MTTGDQHHHSEPEHHAHHEGEHHHDEHKHEHQEGNWNDEAFVAGWLERQKARAPLRDHQFSIIRALIPKTPDQEFRYVNLGSGPGNLDEVLLQRFPGAQATLVDFSLPLLAAARQRLSGFGDRVEYVQANLTTPEWTGAVSGPFDFAFSVRAVHHLEDPRRIRELYAEIYRLLGHGGIFMNLDFVRPSRPSLAPLSQWAEKDPDAGLSGRTAHEVLPGTLLEHLGWLSEAGFPGVEVFWKDLDTALFWAIRDHLHLPDGDSHEHGGGHSHSH